MSDEHHGEGCIERMRRDYKQGDEREAVWEAARLWSIYDDNDRARALEAALDAYGLAAWLEGHTGACDMSASGMDVAAMGLDVPGVVVIVRCGDGWRCPEAQERIDAAKGATGE